MDNAPAKLHPLLVLAAVSVTVASLAAVGVLTGILPGPNTQKASMVETLLPVAAPAPVATPVTPVAAAPVVVEKKAEPAPVKAAPKPVVRHTKPAVVTPAGSDSPNDIRTVQYTPPAPPDYRPAPTPLPQRAPVCRDCGTIDSVREIVEQPTQGPGIGAVAGGVLGGVLGHQIGSGRGNDAATVIGAIGGAVAGHQIEKSKRKSVRYEISVQMDDGARQTISAEHTPVWRGGERVKVSNGAIMPMI